MKIFNTTLLKGDIIIIVIVLLLTLITFILTLNLYNKSSNLVEVHLNGEKIHSLPLDNNCNIIIEDTYQNNIIIENNKVRVINSTCPDGICENFGNISNSGQSIICMPNRLVIKIVSENLEQTETDIDIII